ncbi:MAG: ATP-binding cassette domain-containing protein [Erysipelotrichaceae bacterium]|nr:ATP-binding cassette domain-containing protein [Erysipelotrichaceae bacterium]
MFLQLQDIRKSYGKDDYKIEVLKGIDLQIEKGEFAVMLGPSGSGKSTLLNIIGGIDTADSDKILIEGQALDARSGKQMEKYRR